MGGQCHSDVCPRKPVKRSHFLIALVAVKSFELKVWRKFVNRGRGGASGSQRDRAPGRALVRRVRVSQGAPCESSHALRAPLWDTSLWPRHQRQTLVAPLSTRPRVTDLPSPPHQSPVKVRLPSWTGEPPRRSREGGGGVPRPGDKYSGSVVSGYNPSPESVRATGGTVCHRRFGPAPGRSPLRGAWSVVEAFIPIAGPPCAGGQCSGRS